MAKDTLPPRFQPWRPPQPKGLERKQDRARWRISPRKRGYDSRWDKASMGFRRKHPWCEFCRQEKAEGDWLPTSVTDHVLPAHEYPELRYKRTNWVPLCQFHHDSSKARLEAYARKHGLVAMLEGWVWDPMSRPVHLRPIAVVPGYQPSCGPRGPA